MWVVKKNKKKKWIEHGKAYLYAFKQAIKFSIWFSNEYTMLYDERSLNDFCELKLCDPYFDWNVRL